MSGDAELLVLRLALIGVLFAFVLVVSLTMRSGLAVRRPTPMSQRRQQEGPRLVVEAPGRTGLAPGTWFALAGAMVLGRDDESAIVLGDPSISGRHATVEQATGGWRLWDMGSTNGTFVDGQAVDGRGVLLRGGERIALGAVVMRLQT